MSNETILDRLENERILKIELSLNNKDLIFTEQCDNYYWSYLNKKEVMQLISALEYLAEQMIE